MQRVTSSYAFVILAGGNSSRFGKKKELTQLSCGKTPLSVLSDLISESPYITHVHLVYHPDHYEKIQEHVQGIRQPTSFSIAGQTRQESVYIALEALTSINPDFVLIHDAARPWVSLTLIENICKKLQENSAVIPGVPPTDSIKIVTNNKVEKSLKRDELICVQTPQGFDFKKILDAHRQLHKYQEISTDDAQVWEIAQMGDIAVIQGELANKKITYREDLQ